MIATIPTRLLPTEIPNGIISYIFSLSKENFSGEHNSSCESERVDENNVL